RVGVEGRLLVGDEVSTVVRSPFWTVGVAGPAHRVDPAAYTRGLARLAQARGARIFEGSPVRAVRPGSPSVLRLRGGEVRAATLVLAANAWTPRLGFLRRQVFPLHTCAVATEPLTDAALASVGWEGRQVVFELARQGPTSYLTPDNRLVSRGLLRYRFAGGLRPPDLGRAEALLNQGI